jgi:threonine synthase
VRIEGSRADVTEACHEAVENGEGWYASHAWNPAFVSGTMTFAFEVAAQRNWTAPDVVVLPVGHGTLLLGAYRGFSVLRNAEITDSVPRLIGAQAAGYAPIADQFDTESMTIEEPEDDADTEMVFGNVEDSEEMFEATAKLGETIGSEDGDEDPVDDTPNEIADAIHITDPARETQLVEAIEESGGTALAIGENAVELALDDLHRSGFYTEPTCAIAPAALRLCREQGIISPREDVVVPLTGSGLKTM